jgi:hypothetical protein
MCREESGGGAISPSSTALPKDPYPGASTPAPSLPIRWHSGLVLSLSLSEPTSSHWRHVSLPALPHPRADWHPVFHYGHPKDPALGHEHDEKIELRKPPKQNRAY